MELKLNDASDQLKIKCPNRTAKQINNLLRSFNMFGVQLEWKERYRLFYTRFDVKSDVACIRAIHDELKLEMLINKN
jgi:hypothetical protein